MKNILELKRTALGLGLCGAYKEKWDKATSKEDLMKIVLDSNGVEFLCDGVAFGWGLTSEYIKEEFGQYINSKYVARFDGYASQLFVDWGSDIKATTTLVTLIDCTCDIYVPQWHIINIYLAKNFHGTIHCDGQATIYDYGHDNAYSIIGDRAKIIKVEKSEWIK